MAKEFGKAVAVMALVAGGLYAYTRWRSPDPAPGETMRPESGAEPAPVAAPAMPGPTTQDPPPTDNFAEEAMLAAPVIAEIYECTGSGGRILSDKPCADDAQVRRVRAPNGMVPTKVEAREKPRESTDPGASSSVSLSVVIPALKTCEELDRNEALVNKRLRENPPPEYRQKLRQHLDEYAAARKEWNCGRAR